MQDGRESGITITGGTQNVCLTNWLMPLYPNGYDYRTAYYWSFNGRWEISGPDFVDVAAMDTSAPDDIRVLPLSETLSASGGDTNNLIDGIQRRAVSGNEGFNLAK